MLLYYDADCQTVTSWTSESTHTVPFAPLEQDMTTLGAVHFRDTRKDIDCDSSIAAFSRMMMMMMITVRRFENHRVLNQPLGSSMTIVQA